MNQHKKTMPHHTMAYSASCLIISGDGEREREGKLTCRQRGRRAEEAK